MARNTHPLENLSYRSSSKPPSPRSTNNRPRTRVRSKVVFSMILLFLYAAFLLIDLKLFPITINDSSPIKYTAILVCVIFVMLFSNNPFLQLAMLTTLAADFFLLFTDYYAIGTAIFCFAHFCHSLYILPKKRKQSLILFLVGAVLCAISYWLLIKNNQSSLPTYLPFTVFYAILILRNFLGTLKLKMRLQKDSSANWLFFGMLLFLLCDCSVLLFNVDLSSLPSWISRFVSFSMWMFYLPSQWALCLGGLSRPRSKRAKSHGSSRIT